MAYISADEVKVIRDDLKAAFPLKSGWRFSVRREHHSSVMVVVMAAPKRMVSADGIALGGQGTFDVNPYWYQEQYDAESQKTLKKILDIIKKNWWDESDSQIDYFCTAFYFSLAFGRWDKNCKYG